MRSILRDETVSVSGMISATLCGPETLLHLLSRVYCWLEFTPSAHLKPPQSKSFDAQSPLGLDQYWRCILNLCCHLIVYCRSKAGHHVMHCHFLQLDG